MARTQRRKPANPRGRANAKSAGRGVSGGKRRPGKRDKRRNRKHPLSPARWWKRAGLAQRVAAVLVTVVAAACVIALVVGTVRVLSLIHI